MTPRADSSNASLAKRAGTLIRGGRWIAFAGFAFVLAWLVGLAIGFATTAPGPADSVSTLGAYFRGHRQAAMVQAYLLDGIAGAALIVFAGTLRSALGRYAGDAAAVSSILFGTGIAAGTISMLQGLFIQVLADRVAAIGDGAAVRALYDLNTEGDTYKLLVLGALIGATSLLVFPTGALPRWIGWLGVVLAPLLVVSGWNFVLGTSVQYTAYTVLLLALLTWVAAVSVVSLQRAD